MRLGWLSLGIAAVGLVSGCLGTEQAGSTEASITIDDVQTRETGRTATDEPETDARAEDDPCRGVLANATALLEAKTEDAYADHGLPDPTLQVCGEEGVLLLAAHDLEGPGAIQLAFTFPQTTRCEA